nr:MAG TPA: hypothetical protein [Caudoviricetes sp.]
MNPPNAKGDSFVSQLGSFAISTAAYLLRWIFLLPTQRKYGKLNQK